MFIFCLLGICLDLTVDSALFDSPKTYVLLFLQSSYIAHIHVYLKLHIYISLIRHNKTVS